MTRYVTIPPPLPEENRFVSIYDPNIPFDKIEARFGSRTSNLGGAWDAIPSGHYFYNLLRTLEQLRASGVPVGQGIDRRDLPREGTQLSTVDERVTGTGVGLSPSIVGRQATQNIPNVSVQEKDEEMDLGAIMGGLTQAVDIYGRVKDIQRGTSRQPMVGMQGAVSPTFVAEEDRFGVNPFTLGSLPALIGGGGSLASKIGSAIAGLGLGLAADEIAAVATVCAKTKSRRRRRRLATHSDIKDLAALKAILGSGKAFDTWIATRKM
jgi:hypothetical protein